MIARRPAAYRHALSALLLLAAAAVWPLDDALEVRSGDNTLKLAGPLVQGALVFGHTVAGARVSYDGATLPVDEAGRFVFGFGRGDTGPHQLEVGFADGELIRRTLHPAKRLYDIEHIDGLPSEQVTPPEAVLGRINREARLVARARARTRRSSDWATEFIWPASGRLSGEYGSQRVLNGEPRRPHYGVDISAPEGTPVIAPAPGEVTLAEQNLYFSGGTVIIDHGDQVSSTFMHLQDIDVKVGDAVVQGQPIGSVGATGRATGPHLDWRMNWRRQRVDPRMLLETEHVTLAADQ